MIEYRHHGDGFACTKCDSHVVVTWLAPPPGICDACSVAYDFRACASCGGSGSVHWIAQHPLEAVMRPCHVCVAPAAVGDERCEHVLSSDLRCCLRKGHWAWPSPAAVNGHHFVKEIQ